MMQSRRRAATGVEARYLLARIRGENGSGSPGASGTNPSSTVDDVEDEEKEEEDDDDDDDSGNHSRGNRDTSRTAPSASLSTGMVSYGSIAPPSNLDGRHDPRPRQNQEPVAAADHATPEPLRDSPPTNRAIDRANDDDDEDGPNFSENNAITLLTRRLRCLFAIITWPIVPLGTLAILALVWFFYAFLLDFDKPCSHPLKSYALVTVLWVLYIPSHTTIRSRMFAYVRERDGPNRPPLVRRYDQIFHTLALLYVYAGITLVQTCRDDAQTQLLTIEDNLTTTMTTTTSSSSSTEPAVSPSAIESPITTQPHLELILNTCSATCPNLFPALAIYVTSLEVFTLSLVLPLLFLPCIYLWFLRQVTADRDLAVLQERFREEEEALLNGNQSSIQAQDIIEHLESVKLVRIAEGGGTNTANVTSTTQEETEHSNIVVIPYDATGTEHGKPVYGMIDCCICMSEFRIHDESELFSPRAAISPSRDTCSNTISVDSPCTRNKNPNTSNHSYDEETGHSPRECHEIEGDEIVRPRACGHLFHRRCIASWVGGRWQRTTTTLGNSDASSTPSANERRQRRAKRFSCPLCRSDLRPSM